MTNPNHFLYSFQKQVIDNPHKVAVTFLKDKNNTLSLTYQEVDRSARKISGFLGKMSLESGARIGLIYIHGLDFILAFLGCWYRGLVPVPINCPTKLNLEKSTASILTTINHAELEAILSHQAAIEMFTEANSLLNYLKIPIYQIETILKNEKVSKGEIEPSLNPLALIQYTSGTTSNPKGVMITHQNIIESISLNSTLWGYSPDIVSLTWASPTHIYGLITGLLLPLFNGSLCIMMPTMCFIMHPETWLQAISDYKVTHSGCPNFGYEMCISQVKEVDLYEVNLSSWKVAVNGGELIQAKTLNRFCQKFKPYGFSPESFCPAYGMSEMTGLIAAKGVNRKTRLYKNDNGQLRLVNKEEPIQGSQYVVSCGELLKNTSVKIINPTTKDILKDGQVGEVCLRGSTCTPGYWRSHDNEEHFILLPEQSEQKLYFRTGDLGCIQSNQLIITGRCKDVIIIAGKNYNASDVEDTLSQSGKFFGFNNIAFSINDSTEEKLLIVHEIVIPNQKTYAELVMDIRRIISITYGIDTHGILIVEPGTVSRTNSGKKQRILLKEKYLSKTLKNILYEDIKFN